MSGFDSKLQNVDIICADLKAAMAEAREAAKSGEDVKKIETILCIFAHDLGNLRQGLVVRTYQIENNLIHPLETPAFPADETYAQGGA